MHLSKHFTGERGLTSTVHGRIVTDEDNDLVIARLFFILNRFTFHSIFMSDRMDEKLSSLQDHKNDVTCVCLFVNVSALTQRER